MKTMRASLGQHEYLLIDTTTGDLFRVTPDKQKPQHSFFEYVKTLSVKKLAKLGEGKSK